MILARSTLQVPQPLVECRSSPSHAHSLWPCTSATSSTTQRLSNGQGLSAGLSLSKRRFLGVFHTSAAWRFCTAPKAVIPGAQLLPCHRVAQRPCLSAPMSPPPPPPPPPPLLLPPLDQQPHGRRDIAIRRSVTGGQHDVSASASASAAGTVHSTPAFSEQPWKVQLVIRVLGSGTSIFVECST